MAATFDDELHAELDEEEEDDDEDDDDMDSPALVKYSVVLVLATVRLVILNIYRYTDRWITTTIISRSQKYEV